MSSKVFSGGSCSLISGFVDSFSGIILSINPLLYSEKLAPFPPCWELLFCPPIDIWVAKASDNSEERFKDLTNDPLISGGKKLFPVKPYELIDFKSSSSLLSWGTSDKIFIKPVSASSTTLNSFTPPVV